MSCFVAQGTIANNICQKEESRNGQLGLKNSISDGNLSVRFFSFSETLNGGARLRRALLPRLPIGSEGSTESRPTAVSKSSLPYKSGRHGMIPYSRVDD